MHSQSVFLAVACLALMCLADIPVEQEMSPRIGAEEGGPRPEGKKGPTELQKCCPTLPSVLNETNLQSCMPKKNQSQAERKNRTCVMDCAFKADGYLTTAADGKVSVNLTALNAKLTTLATGEWATIITEAQANCTATAPTIKPKDKCPAGANEIARCLSMHMIVKCPGLNTTDKGCKRMVERISRGPSQG